MTKNKKELKDIVTRLNTQIERKNTEIEELKAIIKTFGKYNLGSEDESR